MGPLRCSQDKECRKNSGETKKFYFQNSNQWDVTQVVLNVEARQNALCGRNVKKENIKKEKQTTGKLKTARQRWVMTDMRWQAQVPVVQVPQ